MTRRKSPGTPGEYPLVMHQTVEMGVTATFPFATKAAAIRWKKKFKDFRWALREAPSHKLHLRETEGRIYCYIYEHEKLGWVAEVRFFAKVPEGFWSGEGVTYREREWLGPGFS